MANHRIGTTYGVVPTKKEKCKRGCDDCEATIRQMFTLAEMKMIHDSLSKAWCQPRDWANMKTALTKLSAVIEELQSEQPV